ncbi:MAG: SprT-like domain-containing protein [Cyclobacteriaceae bacterium]|nr:SprT-like domain-containing protein [Cyclobacteriaceae bacterium]
MENTLEQYIPSNALEYCTDLSANYQFKLDLSFNRKSKFGHYKYWPQTNSHTISINRGLSPSLFLITFIHELAHLDVMLIYGRKMMPHGKEWKATFRKLMAPLLSHSIFETNLLSALALHLKNPKASLSADPRLWAILFPSNDENAIYVNDIEDGEDFIFKQRMFKKVKSRRTRALCYEAKSGNNYLIPLLAEIKKIE